MATTILRLPAVKARTGLSRSTIYARISNGDFPTPVSLGVRAVGWVEAEINSWLEQQIDATRRDRLRGRSHAVPKIGSQPSWQTGQMEGNDE